MPGRYTLQTLKRRRRGSDGNVGEYTKGGEVRDVCEVRMVSGIFWDHREECKGLWLFGVRVASSVFSTRWLRDAGVGHIDILGRRRCDRRVGLSEVLFRFQEGVIECFPGCIIRKVCPDDDAETGSPCRTVAVVERIFVRRVRRSLIVDALRYL